VASGAGTTAQGDGRCSRFVEGRRPPSAAAMRLSVTKTDITKVQDYLRRTFSNTNIRLVPRPKKDDSAEVYIGEEFLGIVSVDDEDGDRSFNFAMAILDIDLED
jgi:hypothetical protein